MMPHDQMLPECREREAHNTVVLLETKEQVGDLWKELLGNGDSSKSISSRLARVETALEERRRAGRDWIAGLAVVIAAAAALVAVLK